MAVLDNPQGALSRIGRYRPGDHWNRGCSDLCDDIRTHIANQTALSGLIGDMHRRNMPKEIIDAVEELLSEEIRMTRDAKDRCRDAGCFCCDNPDLA